MTVTKKPLKIGVMVSGRGSNLQALIDAIGRSDLRAQIVLVASNHPGVSALERAEKAGVPWKVFERREYASRYDRDLDMMQALDEAGTELVVMAGYLALVVPEFIHHYENRIVNIHPSLLPAFGGSIHAQLDAWEWGVKISGCTAHFVTVEVDSGAIILQSAVPVLEDDTAESLAARILEQEHIIYPKAIQLYADGKLKLEGRRVRILD
jgi:phosphoribosylglycinamide formyltransferase 1